MTNSGRGGRLAAKIQKIRADMLFLILAPAKKHLIILTEKDMYELCLREKESGRVPLGIEIVHAELPDELAAALKNARKIAAKEVTPG